MVLSLDWIDLAGTLTATGATPGTVIQASLDQFAHNGWSMDHQALPAVDHALLCMPEGAVEALLVALGDGQAEPWSAPCPPRTQPAEGALAVPHLAAALRTAVTGLDTCLIRSTLSWSGAFWDIAGPLDALGYDGGGGIGSGPGMMVGAALALRGSGRLAIGVLGDGDFLMGCTALWTAARYGIPLLIVVANNRSFYNDEVHQERVAHARGRNPANKWIGQHIGGPDIDLAGMAPCAGLRGVRPSARCRAVADGARSGDRGNAGWVARGGGRAGATRVRHRDDGGVDTRNEARPWLKPLCCARRPPRRPP